MTRCYALLIALIVTPVSTPSAFAQQRQEPLFRYSDVDAAWRAAQQHERPLLVFISSKNCHYCTKMIRETYSHPKIAAAIAERFETAVLLKDRQPEKVKQLGVRALPTTIVVSPEGELLGRVEGFVEPQKFAQVFLMDGSPRQVTQPELNQTGRSNSAANKAVAQR